MSRVPSALVPLACACLIALGGPSLASDPKTALPKGCPDFEGKVTGYMIGSSTMGSVMGPMLKGMLKRRWKVESRHWGKASSGLARPDFHDWPRKAVGLMSRYKPDFVIVSLGTNDNQALRVGKKWLKPKRRDRWEKLYAERVRKMLKALAGPDLARPIVWMGPTAFEGKTARVLGPRINAIMKREVEAFEGNAAFINVYRATRKPNGEMVKTFQAPDRKQPEGLRGDDGIHLTARAVKYLMAQPALKPLEPCFAEHLAAWKAKEKRKAEERKRRAEERKAERIRRRAERKAARIEVYQAKLKKKQEAKARRLQARKERLADKTKRDAPEGSQESPAAPEVAKQTQVETTASPTPTPEKPERPREVTKATSTAGEEKAKADEKTEGAAQASEEKKSKPAEDTPEPSPKKPEEGGEEKR